MKCIVSVLALLYCAAVSGADTASFVLTGGERVAIVEESFSRGIAEVEGCGVADSTCLIDGRIPMGTAGLVPETYVKEISVTFSGVRHVLDSSDMFNAWGRRPLEVKGVVRYFGGKCWNRQNCVFRGSFGDGAGAFVAEWQVLNGVSKRTVISNSEDILELFRKNIDPPIAE